MNGMNGMNATALNVVSKTYDDKAPMHHDDIAQAVADIVAKSIGSSISHIKVSI